MSRQRIFRLLVEINRQFNQIGLNVDNFINISRYEKLGQLNLGLKTIDPKNKHKILLFLPPHRQNGASPAPPSGFKWSKNKQKLLKINQNFNNFHCQSACCSFSTSAKGNNGKSSGNSGKSPNDKITSPVNGIKGSDVINTGKSDLKHVITVVPTSTKISEMSGHEMDDRRRPKLITALRAMNEYCLNEKHLETLPRFERRSAYFGELPQIMYTEADVEKLAIEVHGSQAQQRRLSYEAALKLQSKNLFANIPHPSEFKSKERRIEHERTSKTVWRGPALVVLCAVGVNGFNATMKFIMWSYTGSHCMFAEGIHSVADTLNQIILAVGIHQSIKKPDPLHPYGYSNLRHVTSLISGVGIFFLGTGLSMYHGIQGLTTPEELQPMFWSFVTLGVSFVTEGGTLWFAYSSIKKKAIAQNMTVRDFVWEGQEPGLNVVLLEDCASVLGVSIAATSLAISQYFNSTVPDAMGSLFIGGLLGVVASFIIYSNSVHLVGKSMPQSEVIEIVRNLENDPVVRSVQDVKTTELGGQQTRFKAEVDLDGHHMTKAYLKTQDLSKLLKQVKSFETPEDMEKFLLFHGEQIVDRVGAEIDRIEQDLKLKHPDLRHVDLEVL